MYLLNYDYYDLYALICFFISEPECFNDYKAAVCKIVDYIKSFESQQYSNPIRKLVRPYYDEKNKTIGWVLIDNEYTANTFVIKKAASNEIICAILCEMVECGDDLKRFYLLCDCTHNIPLLLTEKRRQKRAINFMLKDYRKLYNKCFLKNELKRL